jgi:hypothetical protein
MDAAAGIRDKEVNPTEARSNIDEQVIKACHIGDVGNNGIAVLAELARSSIKGILPTAGNDDLHAALDEAMRNGEADATAAARDERDISLVSVHVLISCAASKEARLSLDAGVDVAMAPTKS